MWQLGAEAGAPTRCRVCARVRSGWGPAHPRSGRRCLQELFTTELRLALRPHERADAGYCEEDGVEDHDLRRGWESVSCQCGVSEAATWAGRRALEFQMTPPIFRGLGPFGSSLYTSPSGNVRAHARNDGRKAGMRESIV